jgi:hypothetical protein
VLRYGYLPGMWAGLRGCARRKDVGVPRRASSDMAPARSEMRGANAAQETASAPVAVIAWVPLNSARPSLASS